MLVAAVALCHLVEIKLCACGTTTGITLKSALFESGVLICGKMFS